VIGAVAEGTKPGPATTPAEHLVAFPDRVVAGMVGAWGVATDGRALVAYEWITVEPFGTGLEGKPDSKYGGPAGLVASLTAVEHAGQPTTRTALLAWASPTGNPECACRGTKVRTCRFCNGQRVSTCTCSDCGDEHETECSCEDGTMPCDQKPCDPPRQGKREGWLSGVGFDRDLIAEAIRFAPEALHVDVTGDGEAATARIYGDGFRAVVAMLRVYGPAGDYPAFEFGGAR
jgi:hypothetical protein